jgi:hypothetical protein
MDNRFRIPEVRINTAACIEGSLQQQQQQQKRANYVEIVLVSVS